MSDRTVHASYPGMEIVRYDRAGKWYMEPTDGAKRQAVTIAQAAYWAVWGTAHGGTINFNRPGGGAFDAKVKAAA